MGKETTVKGTVLNGNETEILVRTDRDATIVVELGCHFSAVYVDVKEADYPSPRELLTVWCDKEWEQREKKGLPSGGVPVIQGDRIRYRKEGPGQYVISKIFCKPSDPRSCSDLMQVVAS